MVRGIQRATEYLLAAVHAVYRSPDGNRSLFVHHFHLVLLASDSLIGFWSVSVLAESLEGAGFRYHDGVISNRRKPQRWYPIV
jgi:hypothetical protein